MTGPRTTGVWISASSATGLRWSPEITVRHRMDAHLARQHQQGSENQKPERRAPLLGHGELADETGQHRVGYRAFVAHQSKNDVANAQQKHKPSGSVCHGEPLCVNDFR